MQKIRFNKISDWAKGAVDLAVTVVLWLYFTAGFLIFFGVFYLTAYWFSSRREERFQDLNNRFYRGLFFLMRLLIPRNVIAVDEDVREIRSSVIVCNHVSYLDPVLLVAIFKKHKTIVKSDLFRIPVFGFFLKASGYIPSSGEGKMAGILIDQMERMEAFLESGGNLFIFPEGTRSRDGSVGTLNKGAFKIAKRHRAPIHILVIRNSDKLFQPGRFLFQTWGKNRITVERAGCLHLDDETESVTVSELMERARGILRAQGV